MATRLDRISPHEWSSVNGSISFGQTMLGFGGDSRQTTTLVLSQVQIRSFRANQLGRAAFRSRSAEVVALEYRIWPCMWLNHPSSHTTDTRTKRRPLHAILASSDGRSKETRCLELLVPDDGFLSFRVRLSGWWAEVERDRQGPRPRDRRPDTESS